MLEMIQEEEVFNNIKNYKKKALASKVVEGILDYSIGKDEGMKVS